PVPPRPPPPTLLPYATLFRSTATVPFSLTGQTFNPDGSIRPFQYGHPLSPGATSSTMIGGEGGSLMKGVSLVPAVERFSSYTRLDRKSTRLNSSHVKISYAVF